MKTLIKFLGLVIGFSCLSVTNVYADKDEEEIEVDEYFYEERTRSICPIDVWRYGETISVTFYDLPNEATVSITDLQTGGIISNVYSSPQTVLISMAGRTGGYSIEIYYDLRFFTGIFYLNN